MSQEIRQVVELTYRSHIGLPPQWTPERQRVFLDQEAARLSQLVAELAAEMGETAVTDWTHRMGHQPDYLTKVGLLNTAKLQAREVVLQEQLYAQIPPEPEPATFGEASLLQADSATPEVDWGNPDRWRTLHRSEPTEPVVALVARLWPTRSEWFTIKAEYLLQSRLEDGRPLPTDTDSPLTQQLTRLVQEDLEDDGLPTG